MVDTEPAAVAGATTPDGVALERAMAAYQGGDLAAFEALYAALAPGLRGYLRALARSALSPEDLLQETFLQLHRARHTYLPGRPVKPWVYAIARNVFLMGRRATRRRERREMLAEEELPDLPVPPEAELTLIRRDLAQAVARLGAERCEELLLHHLAGLSFKEIAAVLGISEGAAKVRSHRALRQLQTLVGGGREQP